MKISRDNYSFIEIGKYTNEIKKEKEGKINEDSVHIFLDS